MGWVAVHTKSEYHPPLGAAFSVCLSCFSPLVTRTAATSHTLLPSFILCIRQADLPTYMQSLSIFIRLPDLAQAANPSPVGEREG